MTTMKICSDTPIAALPSKPTNRPTRAWSTTPWIPAITFCSIVGQASFQTAGAMGPSTIERSRALAMRLEAMREFGDRAEPGAAGG